MNFKEFMLQNAIKVENEKFVVSDRFLDEEQKPMEWELKTLTRIEEEAIIRDCYRPKTNNGRTVMELDEILYQGKITASCVLYPELHNKELQDSYRTMSNDQLLKTMLTAKEYLGLQIKLNTMGRKATTLNEKVEQAKN